MPLHTTAAEYLHDLGRLNGLHGTPLATRCQELLRLVGLDSAATRRIGSFSKGMQQRLGLAQALLHQPALLLIDEPGSGLDPAGQQTMIELLAALRASQYTILIGTHQLHEVEQLCDQVGILRAGQLVYEQPLNEPMTTYVITLGDAPIPLPLLDALQQHCPTLQQRGTQLSIPDDSAILQYVLRCVLEAGIIILDVRRETPDLLALYQRVIYADPALHHHPAGPA